MHTFHPLIHMLFALTFWLGALLEGHHSCTKFAPMHLMRLFLQHLQAGGFPEGAEGLTQLLAAGQGLLQAHISQLVGGGWGLVLGAFAVEIENQLHSPCGSLVVLFPALSQPVSECAVAVRRWGRGCIGHPCQLKAAPASISPIYGPQYDQAAPQLPVHSCNCSAPMRSWRGAG